MVCLWARESTDLVFGEWCESEHTVSLDIILKLRDLLNDAAEIVQKSLNESISQGEEKTRLGYYFENLKRRSELAEVMADIERPHRERLEKIVQQLDETRLSGGRQPQEDS